MKLVKRCNDRVIALLIILAALVGRLTLQKTRFVIASISPEKVHQKHQGFTEGPSTRRGSDIHGSGH